MKVGIYPGSFDPVTLGHIDIIKRASKITDKLVVAVLKNNGKNPLFSVEERIAMLKESVKDIKSIEVESFDGLTVDFAKKMNASVIIRGLRAVTDFEYELQLAQTNRELYSEIDTVFLLTNLRYSYLSSSTVKEVASYGGDISKFVTTEVANKLIEKYKK